MTIFISAAALKIENKGKTCSGKNHFASVSAMNRRILEWLSGEIGEWERQGVVTAEQAAKIRSRYVMPKSRPLLPLLLSLFGGLLIGLGVILLLAHNWDQIPRWVRTVVAYLPLGAAIGIAARVIREESPAVGAREGAGLFLFLTTGAALSLVAQSYHLGGSFRNLLLIWMIVMVPALYALEAAAAALLYLAGITAWSFTQRSFDDSPYAFWLLLGVVCPLGMGLIRKRPMDPRGFWLSWGIVISASLALIPSLQGDPPMPWLLGYSLWFACLLLMGITSSASEARGGFTADWRRPFFFVGAAGLGVTGWILAYKNVWDATDAADFWDLEISAVQGRLGVMVYLALVLVVSFLLVIRWRGSSWPVRVGGILPLMVVMLVAIHLSLEAGWFPMVVMNLFLFVWSGVLVWSAIVWRRSGLLNAGLLLFSALVLARFFDSDLSYVIRGLVFVVVGIIFLLMNQWVARLRRHS